LRYDKPFIFNKNGVIKAISYDVESNNKSSVAIKELDLSHDFFSIIEPKEGTRKVIDANVYSTMYINNNEKLTFEFDEEQSICGFRYTPNQSRDASRHIVDYELYVDGKLVKAGTFGNIKNNPIEQVVRFEEVKGKTVTFVPTRSTDDSRNGGIAEFSVITK
jgi:alpha-L-fucosidase